MLPGKFDSPESRTAFDRLRARWLNDARQVVPEPTAAPGPTVTMLAHAFYKSAVTRYVDAAGDPRASRPTTAT